MYRWKHAPFGAFVEYSRRAVQLHFSFHVRIAAGSFIAVDWVEPFFETFFFSLLFVLKKLRIVFHGRDFAIFSMFFTALFITILLRFQTAMS